MDAAPEEFLFTVANSAWPSEQLPTANNVPIPNQERVSPIRKPQRQVDEPEDQPPNKRSCVHWKPKGVQMKET